MKPPSAEWCQRWMGGRAWRQRSEGAFGRSCCEAVCVR